MFAPAAFPRAAPLRASAPRASRAPRVRARPAFPDDAPRLASWHRASRRRPRSSPRATTGAASPTSRGSGSDAPSDASPANETARPTRRSALVLGAAASGGLLLPPGPGPARASPASSRVTLAELDKRRGDAAALAGPSPSPQTPLPRSIAPGTSKFTGTESLTPVANGALTLSPMGLGTWSWGNQFVWQYEEENDPELRRVFDAAVAAGVNVFDTADSYGTGSGLDGRSEVLLGQFLKQYPDREAAAKVNIATKFAAYPWRVTRGSVVKAARESRERLGKGPDGAIELGQLHWSTGNYQPLQERALWAGIADAYESGVIKAVGLSNYGPEQLRRVHAYMTKRGVPIATLQVQYHLLSRFPEFNGTKETCDELGIRMIAYSPLGLGLLTGKYSDANPPPGLRGVAYKGVLPPLPGLLETMRAVGAARGGKTPAQVAINWCLSKDTTPIPGAKNVKQLEENLGALGWRLSEAEVKELDDAAEKVGVSASQNIFQTK